MNSNSTRRPGLVHVCRFCGIAVFAALVPLVAQAEPAGPASQPARPVAARPERPVTITQPDIVKNTRQIEFDSLLARLGAGPAAKAAMAAPAESLDEKSAIRLMALGRQLGRPVSASLAAKAYLASHPRPSANFLLLAAQVASDAGDYRWSADRYRSLLTMAAAGGADDLSPGQLSDAAASFCSLLIDVLDDEAGAYRFMRQLNAPSNLRSSPAARRFDAWFAQQARARNDYPALARFLAVVLAERRPLEQERLYFWENLDWLMNELANWADVSEPRPSGSGNNSGSLEPAVRKELIDALPSAIAIAGEGADSLIRDNKTRIARFQFYVANLAFQSQNTGAATVSERPSADSGFARVIAAAKRYVDAAPTAETVRDTMLVFAGGGGRDGNPVYSPNLKIFDQQLPAEQQFFVYAFDRLNDGERSRLLAWVARLANSKWTGWSYHARPATIPPSRLASREHWADLGARHAPLFAASPATASLPLLLRADNGDAFTRQSQFLRDVPSYDAAVINSVAAAIGANGDATKAAEHLARRETWHLSFADVFRAFESDIWPALVQLYASEKQKTSQGVHDRAIVLLGRECVARSALGLYDPAAAGRYLLAAWDSHDDKSRIIDDLKSLEWIPWSARDRKTVLAGAYTAFRRWSGDMTAQANRASATTRPGTVRLADRKLAVAAAQIPKISAAFKRLDELTAIDPNDAPNPLARAMVVAELAARTTGRFSPQFVNAAKEVYKLAAAPGRPITGRACLQMVLKRESYYGSRDVELANLIIVDQFSRYDPAGRTDELDWIIATLLPDYASLPHSQGSSQKINAAMAEALLAQLDKGCFYPPLFSMFRATRKGQGWYGLDWGQDVMAKIIARRTFAGTDYRPSSSLRGETVSYMNLVRNEFPKLNATFPVASWFDEMFIAEAAKTGLLDSRYWDYGRDPSGKVVAAAANILKTHQRLPLGYNDESAVYSRADLRSWLARTLTSGDAKVRDPLTNAIEAEYGRTRFDTYAMGWSYFSTRGDVTTPAGRKEFFDRLARYLERASDCPTRSALPNLRQLYKLDIGGSAGLTARELDLLVSIFRDRTPQDYPAGNGYDRLAELVGRGLLARGRSANPDLFAVQAHLWKIARDMRAGTQSYSSSRGEDCHRRLVDLCRAVLARAEDRTSDQQSRPSDTELALVLASSGLELGWPLTGASGASVKGAGGSEASGISGDIVEATDPQLPDTLIAVRSKARADLAELGNIDTVLAAVPVSRLDPRYPILAAQAAFLAGRIYYARQLYEDCLRAAKPEFPGRLPGQPQPPAPARSPAAGIVRDLDGRFCCWLIELDTEAGRYDSAESLARVLISWLDSVGGESQANRVFNNELRGRAALDLADIFFARQEYPIAAARYTAIASADEFKNTTAAPAGELKLAEVYRLTRRYDQALGDLDKLVQRLSAGLAGAGDSPGATHSVGFSDLGELRSAGPSDGAAERALLAQAHYQIALVKFDQEEYREARQQLDRVFALAPAHADGRILEGKVFLKLKRVELATEIELGSPVRRQFISPGSPLAVTLRDQSLTILADAGSVELRAWTDGHPGDEEFFQLTAFADSRTRFKGRLPTALAAAKRGDGVLQVLGGEHVYFAYSESFRRAHAAVARERDRPFVLTVATDAELFASSGKLSAIPANSAGTAATETAVAIAPEEEAEDAALSTARPADRIKPGSPVRIRVIDPDRSATSQPDTIYVQVTTGSGDSIAALPLVETGPVSGVFEGEAPTAASLPVAVASDCEEGKDANFAISPRAADYGPWVARPDRMKPKTFTIDLNDNVAVGRMSIAADATRRLTSFAVQTSLNGRDFQTVACWPEAHQPWDGTPTVELVRYEPTTAKSVVPARAPGASRTSSSEPRTAAEIRDYLDLGHLQAGQPKFVVTTRPSGQICLDAALAGQAKAMALSDGATYIAHFSMAFYQPMRRTRILAVVPRPPADSQPEELLSSPRGEGVGVRGSSQRQGPLYLVLVDGQGAGQAVRTSLGKGVHRIDVFVVARVGEPIAADLMWDDEASPGRRAVLCPADAFDTKLHPEIRQGVYRPAGQATLAPGEADRQTFDVTFPAETSARIVRLLLLDYEGDAPAISRIAMSDAADKAVLPAAQDFLALRRNRVLEIIPGDQITVSYADPILITEGRNLLTASLTATYSDATIEPCFIEYQGMADGVRRARYVPMRRFDPAAKDVIGVLINDPDMDTTGQLDTVKFTARASEGQTVELTAIETEPHSGVFLGKVFPVTGEAIAPARPGELVVRPGDDIVLSYQDRENTTPGIPWPRSCTVEQVCFVTPELLAYTTRSEPVEEPAGTGPGAMPAYSAGMSSPGRPGMAATKTAVAAMAPDGTQKISDIEIVPAERRLVTSRPDLDDAAAPAVAMLASESGFCLVEVIFPTIAKSPQSTTEICVQTSTGRKAFGKPLAADQFNPEVPGTIKLTARPSAVTRPTPPPGYAEVLVESDEPEMIPGLTLPGRPTALDDGRFAFTIRMELGKLGVTPAHSAGASVQSDIAATETTVAAMAPDGALANGEQTGTPVLTVNGGDEIFIGFKYTDAGGAEKWQTRRVVLDADAFFHVTDRKFQQQVSQLYIGQTAYLRVIDPRRDTTDAADTLTVELTTSRPDDSAARPAEQKQVTLRETFNHSGVFKGLIEFGFAELAGGSSGQGLAVQYGDKVVATYVAQPPSAVNGAQPLSAVNTSQRSIVRTIDVFKGSNAILTTFSKHHAEPDMAMRTQFMMAEAYMELAKRHRELGEAEAAARELAVGTRLLEEAVRDYPKAEARAQMEYLLADLALELGNEAKDPQVRKGQFERAIALFSAIVASYPESEQAPKAQFKKALTLERLGRFDDACDEYVKLSYRYPASELVAETIARLGHHFMVKGKSLREEADKQSDPAKRDAIGAESRKTFKTAGQVLRKLGQRFPDHALADKTAVLAAQCFMYAEDYQTAIEAFDATINNPRADQQLIAEAIYWCADSYLKLPRRRAADGQVDPVRKAYQLFKRLDWDFPTTKWAKFARGRLATDEQLGRIKE